MEKVLYLMPKSRISLSIQTHIIQNSRVSVLTPQMVQVVIVPHCWFEAKSKKAFENICHNYGSQWYMLQVYFGIVKIVYFVKLMPEDKEWCERILTWDTE